MVQTSSMNKKIIVLTGPTGVGKTTLSLRLAATFNGEIINADASQIRKKLDIGTAKIDLQTTNIKHHLLDFLTINEDFSIYDYQRLARQKIDDLLLNNKLPFLVGGSGLYLNSTLYDYDLSSPSRQAEFAQQFIDLTDAELHLKLQGLDSAAAENIPINNRRRVLRALELAMGDAKRISENISSRVPLYDCLVICFTTERTILYQRINDRVESMFVAGWIKECQDLLDEGIDLHQIKDIGYSEIGSYLQGEITLEKVKDIIKQKTRNYAKRQLTWFKNKMNCLFINIDYENQEQNVIQVTEIIDKFLKNI